MCQVLVYHRNQYSIATKLRLCAKLHSVNQTSNEGWDRGIPADGVLRYKKIFRTGIWILRNLLMCSSATKVIRNYLFRAHKALPLHARRGKPRDSKLGP